MITDKLTMFSGSVSSAGALSGQAIAASPTVSTNSYDTGPRAIGGNQPARVGSGEELQVCVTVLVAPTVATSVEFQLIQADDAALTTNVEVISSTGAIAIASLTLLTNLYLEFRRTDPLAPRRYIGVRYVVVGTATSAGTYSAAMVANFADKQTSYASGYSIS